MLTVAVVCDFIGSACRIGNNSLIVGHSGNRQSVAVCVLYPIQFAVCIEVIPGLSCVCDCVSIAGFCHCAVSVQALKSAVSIVLKRGVRAIGEYYLIVTLCRNHDFAYVNIEVPANTEAAFFITH